MAYVRQLALLFSDLDQEIVNLIGFNQGDWNPSRKKANADWGAKDDTDERTWVDQYSRILLSLAAPRICSCGRF